MAEKATGTAGHISITDDGTWVAFRISCSDSATRTYGKSWSGRINGVNVSGTFDFNAGAGSINVGGPWRVSTSQTVSFTMGATLTQGLGGPTSLSTSISRSKPTAPSGLQITRASDKQHTLNWTRNGTYTSVVVQRSENDGSWKQVGIASGNAWSFTDKSTSANRKYEYRVAGRAASGTSSWSGQATVYTTPAAPSGVKAARSGNNIKVSASGTPPYASTYEVRDGSTVLGTGSLPYTDVAPDPAVPHSYTVRAVRGSLRSAWSAASNTVQLISPPNAPTGLSPNGAVRASDADVLFKWVHNPVDSSDQTAFELQWREPGGAWTTATGTTDEQVTVPLDVGSVEWQVRTKGEHPDWSPWSATATFTVIDRPGVAILVPSDVWDASILDVVWSWFQAQDRPQSAWQYELLDDSLTVVEARNGSGAIDTGTLNKRLTEGGWTIRVRAATGDVWSEWAEETFTVVFDPPGEPILTGEWDETQGGVGLQVAGETFGVAVLDDGVWYAEFGE